MLTLQRTVRFAINERPTQPGVNGYAGSPPMVGLGRHYEVDVACTGEPDPVTGYLIDIKDIDRAVRERIVPAIHRACTDGADAPRLLPGLVRLLDDLPARVSRLRLRLSPYHSFEMASDARDTVLIRQMFDFSAAHRLHSPSLSDEENRRVFGKCNNPAGHGHNYRLEVAVAVEAGNSFTLADLEEITNESLIRRFDHKNLNADTEEFGPSGVMPTVENIARVFHGQLAPLIAARSKNARLRSITVWETDRTCCTYPA